MTVLLGSPLFLRLWSSLVARAIAASPETMVQLVDSPVIAEAALVLYEDGLLNCFPELKQKHLRDGTPPCWIPLPSPGKERHPYDE